MLTRAGCLWYCSVISESFSCCPLSTRSTSISYSRPANCRWCSLFDNGRGAAAAYKRGRAGGVRALSRTRPRLLPKGIHRGVLATQRPRLARCQTGNTVCSWLDDCMIWRWSVCSTDSRRNFRRWRSSTIDT